MQRIFKIIKQTFWQISGKFVTSVASLIILGLVSREFGEEGTGVFTLALTYLAFFYLIADFGFNAHILPKLSQNGENIWRKLLGTRLLWSGLLVLVSLLTLPFLPFKSMEFNFSVLIGVLAITFSSIFVTSNVIFQNKLRYDLSALATSFGAIVTLFFTVLIIYKNSPIPYLVFGHMFGWMICGVVSWYLVKKFLKKITPLFDFKFIQTTIQEAWPISATLLLNVVYFRVDAFILTSVKSFIEAGVYNLAYQIFQSALLISTYIINSLYPFMVKDLALSKLKFIKNLIIGGLIMLGLGVLGTFLTLVLSPWVISQVTGGNGFTGSIDALNILSLSFPAFFVSAILMWVLITLKEYKIMMLIYSLGLLFNVVLNFIFIPQYSYIGAAYVTAGSEYLILILQLIILFPKLRNLT